MFRKILIANRGEIACRVIATARRLGIATVAVYSEADANARHVEMADEAWPIGPAPARQSYLVGSRILEVAKQSGAEAIHPGYGFLSENADFAAACAASGVVFIGPPVGAIRAMGSKAASKELMEKSGVPLVPGYHGTDQSPDLLAHEAERIGFPVLIKASAGGGGKGMKIVNVAGEFGAALEGAKREALASFGDDRVLIEKYLTRPRHIEIQVFADSFGNTVSLFERDCSIQRRHQKVLEEAPAPGMDPGRRRAMGDAAVAAAKAVGYVGAGTVEFIAEGDGFFFMEMNTRLQVEHPVTEMITGIDLVEWQLRVASGEALPIPAMGIAIDGHAIEARVYAEDPSRDFLPAVGRLEHLVQPREVAGQVRVDTGVRSGDTISPHYDPMIAKLIVWGEDRTVALSRLSAALAQYEVVGLRTNLGLLRAIAAHPEFANATLDTGFIARNAADLMPEESARIVPAQAWVAAAYSVLEAERAAAREAAAVTGDIYSPWADIDAWRMNGDGYQDVALLPEGAEAPVVLRLHPREAGFSLDLPEGRIEVKGEDVAGVLHLSVNGVRRKLRVVRLGDAVTVIEAGQNFAFTMVDVYAPPRRSSGGGGKVLAPVPGRVTRVMVAVGDAVVRNQPLVVIEAMKTEFTLTAPQDGVVADIRHAVDDMVSDGAELVVLKGE